MDVHGGHRERLRSRFLEHGLDNFNEINALELLLFYSIPRRDTNVIAHALLEQFGSLDEVFQASIHELCQVPGVGENSAALIKLVPQILKKSMTTKAMLADVICCSEDAGKYLAPRFAFEREEVVFMLCLDSQKRVICCKEMGRGVVNSVETNVRRIVETALKANASAVIFAHNHPDGIAMPSVEDRHVTKQINSSLALVGIPLVDHIIFAGEDFVSFADSGLLGLLRY